MILMELDMQPIEMTFFSRKTGMAEIKASKDDTSGTELDGLQFLQQKIRNVLY